jgi:hypothetical protein
MEPSAETRNLIGRPRSAAAPVVAKVRRPAPAVPAPRNGSNVRPYLVGTEGNTHVLVRLGDLVMRGAVENGVPACLRDGTARVIRKVEHPSRAIAYVIGEDGVEILVRPSTA